MRGPGIAVCISGANFASAHACSCIEEKEGVTTLTRRRVNKCAMMDDLMGQYKPIVNLCFAR